MHKTLVTIKSKMKKNFYILMIFVPTLVSAQPVRSTFSGQVTELDNSIFKKDKYWRGADGAASINLGKGRILWLFSDSIIDEKGTGKRANANTMIRNSVAIQRGHNLETADLTFFYKGTNKEPKDFFNLPGDNWFWTGHGTMVNNKLIIFLFEERSTKTGIGFEAVGWHVAIVDNPKDAPNDWNINYFKGTDTFGVIVGSSAVLKSDQYIYAYGVKEPSKHRVYLLRFDSNKFMQGDFSNAHWWVDGSWKNKINKEPIESSLFWGQTEFSVHYDKKFDRYVQIQTFGHGKASIGYRLSKNPEGPWSDPVTLYTPALGHPKEFVYTANAHPELGSDSGLIVTYNVNNGILNELITNENIYFPRIVNLAVIDK
ncbi:DUF4185 domain-containing protein [Fulvivirgaceae bacterium BMA12]|uniref:DUF4185 domain-containing protein n=1 Tax=Agaribacillus aureus TaxID=3051825 RepID=A0ABT8LA84_9BACT|nr:DUF4185 domain-containing protein [Fulvivirgaceae bacterium BMA12]